MATWRLRRPVMVTGERPNRDASGPWVEAIGRVNPRPALRATELEVRRRVGFQLSSRIPGGHCVVLVILDGAEFG